mmetsp:Transcript_33107/g.30010  ORF Transcript_33107/g.30010 Transcript_33107/m.30010 type:complete len:100 (-) Transcript_33107:495-794(-)
MSNKNINLEDEQNTLKESLTRSAPSKYNNAPPQQGKFFSKRCPWQEMPDRYVVANYPDTQIEHNGISTTKYSWLTFIPKNLYEQFSKAANLYFLLIGLL